MSTEKLSGLEKWDRRFLQLSQTVSQWSKDPSQGVGSVIVDPERRVVSLGFNGFPRGIQDSEGRLNDRSIKLQYTIHAETNAILQAKQDLTGTTIYCNIPPCSSCGLSIIQAGIQRVVTYVPDQKLIDRWGESFDRSLNLFKEAGLEYKAYVR
jgi:dCMP deaminase